MVEQFVTFDHDILKLDGHPTDFVHRISLSFLAFITIQTDSSGNFQADQYLLQTIKDTKLAGSSISVILEVFSKTDAENIPKVTTEDRNFLLLIHALSKLSKWNHNRELITTVFGNSFFVVLSSTIKAIIQNIEELVTVWNEIENTAKMNDYLIYLQLILSTILGMTQVLSRFSASDYCLNEIYDFGNPEIPPYSINKIDQLGIDILLKSIPLVTVPAQSPQVRQSGDTAAVTPKKKGKQTNKALKAEEAMTFVLPILMNSIRKLYLLSKTIGMMKNPKDRSVSLDGALILSIMVHNETILTASNMLLTWPQLLSTSINCDCSGSVSAFLTLKDALHFHSVHYHHTKLLILQRSMLVLHFHEISLRASAILKNYRKVVFRQHLDCFKSLELVFNFYIEEIRHNRKAKIPKVPWKIRSESVGKIGAQYPCTDLFPWTLHNKTTTAMFRSKMTELSQEYEASFISFMAQYWKERKNFLPVHPDDLLQESKSYLCSILAQLDRLPSTLKSRNDNPFPSSSNVNYEPILGLLQLPEIELIHHLFKYLTFLIWKSPEKSCNYEERKEVFQEIGRVILNIVKTNGVSTFPDIAFVLFSLIFMTSSFKVQQSETVIFARGLSFWREFLTVILPRRENEPKLDQLISKHLIVRRDMSNGDDYYVIENRSSLGRSGSATSLPTAAPSTPVSTTEDAPPLETSTSSSNNNSHSNLSGEVVEDYGETLISYRLFAMDLTLEVLWIFCSYKILTSNSSSSGSQSANVTTESSYDEEDWALIDCISSSTTDCSVFITFRWFVNLVHLNSKLTIKSKVWFEVIRKGLLLLKNLTDPHEESRAFFWPSKVTVVRLLAYVMYACSYEEWFHVFTTPVASSPDNLSGLTKGTAGELTQADPSAPTGKLTKHLILFRVALDERCRTFASAMIMRLLYACAAESAKNLRKKPGDYSSIKEILAHDVVKCIFNIIKNRYQHSKKHDDGTQTSKSLLQGLVVLMRFPSAFAAETDVLLEAKHVQDLMMSYGTFTARHKNYFSWTHSRHNIMKDLIICIDYGIEIENILELDLLILCITFYTALMSKNEQAQLLFRNLVNSVNRRRRSVSAAQLYQLQTSSGNAARMHSSGASIQNDHHRNQHDLVQLICSVIGKKQESLPVLLALFECLLNVLPSHLKKEYETQLTTGQTIIPREGFFSNMNDPIMIKNIELLNVILSLVPYSSPNAQSCILNSIIQLFQRKLGAIKNFTTSGSLKPTVIDIILDIFTGVSKDAKLLCIKLLEIFGGFSITVSELKRVIQVLRQSDKSALVTATYLIDALKGTLTDNEDPQFYFLFEGKEGGILLPPFQNWPAANGYTFLTWISFNNRATIDIADEYNLENQKSMVVFSVLQPTGSGFEILATPRMSHPQILDFEIVLSVKGNSPSSKTLCSLNLEKSNRTWHFLAVSQTKGKILGRSQLTIVLDNEVYKKEISYPRFKDGVMYGGIGCLHPPDSTTPLPPERSAFFGRMSTIYLYSEGLSMSLLQYIEKVGFSKFHEVSNNLEDVKALQLDAASLNSLILSYNPGIASGEIIYNSINDSSYVNRWQACQSPNSESQTTSNNRAIYSRAFSNPDMDGTLLPETYVCSSRDMRNALDCLGGIKVILPLFSSIIEFNGEETSEYQFGEVVLRFCEILKLFVITLRDTVQNKNFMIQNGFAYLSYFIHQLNPYYIEVGVVHELQHLLERFGGDESWSMNCLSKVFCDFTIWSITPFATQELLLQNMQHYVTSRAEQVRKTIGVQRFFHALYLYYTEKSQKSEATSSSSSSANTTNPAHSSMVSSQPSSSQLGGKESKESFQNSIAARRRSNGAKIQLDHQQLVTIRSYIFDIIFLTITNSNSTDLMKEIEAVINYIAYETVAQFKIEGMQLLLRLINPEKFDLSRKIFEGICKCNGLLVLSNLQSHPRAKVRIYAWVTICYLLHTTLILSSSEYYQNLMNPALATTPSGNAFLASPSTKGNVSEGGTRSRRKTKGSSHDQDDDALENQKKRNSASIDNLQSSPTHPSSGANPGVRSENVQYKKEYCIWRQLGIEQISMAAWLNKMWRANLEQIKLGLADGETTMAQLKLVFFILENTMYGRSCKFLINEIEKIPLQKADPETAHHPSPTMSTQVDVAIDQYDLENESHKICIPMIFPVIIDVLKSSICDFNLRIQLFDNLFSHLQYIENYDMIMSIPKWQSLILDFFCELEGQIKEFVQSHHLKNNSPTLMAGMANLIGRDQQIMAVIIQTSKLVDVVAAAFTGLHIVAVQFGELKGSKYKIELPTITPYHYSSTTSGNDKAPANVPHRGNDHLSPCEYLSYSTKELFDIIKKDQRALGCSGILKTISYIRCYATQGLIDWEDVGVGILQLLVNRLHDSVVSLRQTTIIDELEKDIRLKIFEINIWLTVEAICEFIAVPPTQLAQPKRLQTSASSTQLSSLSSSHAGSTLSKSIGPLPTIKRVTSAPEHEDINQENSDSFRTLIRKRTGSEGGIVTDMTEGLDIRVDHFSSTFDTSAVAGIAERSVSGKIGKSTEADIFLDNEAMVARHEHLMNELVSSVISLLGLNERGTGSWLGHDRLKRLEAAIKVGFTRGRYVLHSLQESVDALLQQGEAGPTSITNVDHTPSKADKLRDVQSPRTLMNQRFALDKIVEHSLWLLLRVLLKIALNSQHLYEEDYNYQWNFKATEHLSRLLNWAKQYTKSSYDEESLYVLAFMTTSIHKFPKIKFSSWTHLMLKTICEITQSQRAYIDYSFKQLGIPIIYCISSLPLTSSSNSLLERSASPLPSSQKSSFDVGKSGNGTEKLARPPSLINSPPSARSSYSERDSFSEDSFATVDQQVMARIIHILNVSKGLGWDEWNVLMNEILKNSSAKEFQFVNTRLDNVGLHKISEETYVQLENFRRIQSDFMIFYEQEIKTSTHETILREQRLLRDYLKLDNLEKKAFLKEWTSLYDELCNERAPWGTGMSEAGDVSYCLLFETFFLIFLFLTGPGCVDD